MAGWSVVLYLGRSGSPYSVHILIGETSNKRESVPFALQKKLPRKENFRRVSEREVPADHFDLRADSRPSRVAYRVDACACVTK